MFDLVIICPCRHKHLIFLHMVSIGANVVNLHHTVGGRIHARIRLLRIYVPVAPVKLANRRRIHLLSNVQLVHSLCTLLTFLNHKKQQRRVLIMLFHHVVHHFSIVLSQMTLTDMIDTAGHLHQLFPHRVSDANINYQKDPPMIIRSELQAQLIHQQLACQKMQIQNQSYL